MRKFGAAVEAHDFGLHLAALVLVEFVDAADGVGRRRRVLEVNLSIVDHGDHFLFQNQLRLAASRYY